MKHLLIYNFRQIFFARKNLLVLVSSAMISLIALNMMSQDATRISSMLPLISVLFTIIPINCTIDQIYKYDHQLGILDFVLITHDPIRITIVKFLVTFLLSIFSITLISIISYFIFPVPIYIIYSIIIGSIPAMICSSAIFSTMAAINIYFENKSTIISCMIIPFILPSLIVYGLFIETSEIKYLLLSLGIDCIVVPVCVYLGAILICKHY